MGRGRARGGYPGARPLRWREGFTLVEVMIAMTVLTVGLLGTTSMFKMLYDQINPRGAGGGLRRYMVAESMLKAQAEALRASKAVSTVPNQNVKVVPPPNFGYQFRLEQVPVPAPSGYAASAAGGQQELYKFDLKVEMGDPTLGEVATLTMTTLRSTKGTQDEKIGL